MSHKRAAVGFHSAPATDDKPKRTKVHDGTEISNDDVFHNIFSRLPMEISEDILRSILSRLPPNRLMRFRCVSMHWNSLISDPYFINSRSCPKILLSGPFSHLNALHLNVLDNKPHSMINLPFPIKTRRRQRRVLALGTFNGIVVLARENGYHKNKLVLYNPLTGATLKLPNPLYKCCNLPNSGDLFGFAHGDDPKIYIGHTEYLCNRCEPHYFEVFSLKKGSWTMSNTRLVGNVFDNTVGVFLNGFLHWPSIYLNEGKIVALDVKKMVVLIVDVPPRQSEVYIRYGLGRLQGCLCLIEPIHEGFDVWVMKEHRVSESWSKEYSFTFSLEYDYKCLHTVCILEDGRIVVMDGPYRVVLCDPSKGSYNVFTNTNKMFMHGNGIEYVETLASPSDFFHV